MIEIFRPELCPPSGPQGPTGSQDPPASRALPARWDESNAAATALRLVQRLSAGDLNRLVNNDKVPTLVRVHASRILEDPRADSNG